MSQVIDYTENFKKYSGNENVLVAQGKGKHFLTLVKLKETIRIGKHVCRYMLEYRELTQACESENDECYVCVWDNDIQYFLRKEVKSVLDELKTGKVNIFNHFNLF